MKKKRRVSIISAFHLVKRLLKKKHSRLKQNLFCHVVERMMFVSARSNLETKKLGTISPGGGNVCGRLDKELIDCRILLLECDISKRWEAGSAQNSSLCVKDHTRFTEKECVRRRRNELPHNLMENNKGLRD